MKKRIIFSAVAMALLMTNPAYAECDHNYIREYNYSIEVLKIPDKHFYRDKCSKCLDIKMSKDIMYENCSYDGQICTECNTKKANIPQYEIKLSKENQDYVYQNCEKYGIIDSYTALIATMYRKSEFNESLEKGPYKGLFQLNSLYDYSWLIGRENYDLLDAKDNIEIGVALYDWYYEKYEGNFWKTIVAVNSGVATEDMNRLAVQLQSDTITDIEVINDILNFFFNLNKT